MAPYVRSFRSTTPVLGTVILLLALTGCITLKDPFSAESRINRYMAKHPDRPEAIKASLVRQTLCTNMTPDEVILCWGEPNKREPAEANGVREEIWSYYDRRHGGTSSEGHGSALFDYNVPLGQVVFLTATQGLVLSEWTIYGEENAGAVSRQQPTSTAAVAAKPATPEAIPEALPEVTPNVDLSRWPSLHVTGIMKGGRNEVARINDTLVKTGETIEGVTVVAMSHAGVYLRYGAETICLAKGAQTRPPAHGLFKK